MTAGIDLDYTIEGFFPITKIINEWKKVNEVDPTPFRIFLSARINHDLYVTAIERFQGYDHQDDPEIFIHSSKGFNLKLLDVKRSFF